MELLGDYLPLLADAAVSGRRPKRAELEAVGLLGRQAAEQGISAGRAVQLYLSAARRLWQDLPIVVRSRDRDAVRAAAAAVLHVIDGAVATLADGYAVARRDLVRREETLRRELIDDLLRGDSDLGALVERAEPFGLDLARVHQVALGRAEPTATGHRRGDQPAGGSDLQPARRPRRPGGDEGRPARRAGTCRSRRRPTTSHPPPRTPAAISDASIHGELNRLPRGRPWRVAVGRPHPGLYGIARSYEEAREALTMAGRLPVDTPVVSAHDLLIYRVLLRDQPAIVDLVHAVLSPLVQARGGAEPLLATLEAYFATGAVATESAKRLHVAVRTVTYRLDRIRALTGYNRSRPGPSVHPAGGGARRQSSSTGPRSHSHGRLSCMSKAARTTNGPGPPPSRRLRPDMAQARRLPTRQNPSTVPCRLSASSTGRYSPSPHLLRTSPHPHAEVVSSSA